MLLTWIKTKRKRIRAVQLVPPTATITTAPAAEVARYSQVNLIRFIERSDDILFQQIQWKMSPFQSIRRASSNRRPGGVLLIFSCLGCAWIKLNLLQLHKTRADLTAMSSRASLGMREGQRGHFFGICFTQRWRIICSLLIRHSCG
ncbi:hypothetical protein Mapa_004914 [Marchantia paleacea]|nr:hypothetical protein Mapa_004914 [Marchantia paleacea]